MPVASHQLCRSFLHLHDISIQAVIYAYLQPYYGFINEKAFSVLHEAIRMEVDPEGQNMCVSEFWDVAILQELLKDDVARDISPPRFASLWHSPSGSCRWVHCEACLLRL